MRYKFITVLVLFFSIQVSGQIFNEGDFYEKYRSVFLGFGPRTLNTTPGTILTEYTDESPSQDHFESSVEVKDEYKRLGFQLGYKWGRYIGLSHSILFDISLGENPGGAFTYSLGYNLPFQIGDNALIVRPAFFGGFGNYSFELGQLKNNAGYIEINGIEFYDSELDVSLSSQVFLYGPEVDFMFMIGEHFEVFTNLNYNLKNDNTRPKIVFTTTEQEDEDSTSLEIDGDNPNVTYNGKKMTNLPYDIGGLRLTVGIAYVWNYD